MQKDLPIYEGFADGLNALNREIISDKMTATPVGRGYKSVTGIYLSQVHIVSLGEEGRMQLPLAEDFNANPDIFGGRVYMGGAGLLNFSFIAAARPAAAILFDINAAQKIFWDDAIEALAKNPKIEGFLEFLIEERKNLHKKLSETFNEGAVRFFSKNDPSRDYAYRNGSSLEHLTLKNR